MPSMTPAITMARDARSTCSVIRLGSMRRQYKAPLAGYSDITVPLTVRDLQNFVSPIGAKVMKR